MKSDEITRAINRVCDTVGGDIDDFVRAAGIWILERVEW